MTNLAINPLLGSKPSSGRTDGANLCYGLVTSLSFAWQQFEVYSLGVQRGIPVPLKVLLAGRAEHTEGGGWSYNNLRPRLGKFCPSPITNAQIVLDDSYSLWFGPSL